MPKETSCSFHFFCDYSAHTLIKMSAQVLHSTGPKLLLTQACYIKIVMHPEVCLNDTS